MVICYAVFLWIHLVYIRGAKLPNIIFILTDDMGNADASFNFKITNPDKADSPPIITPNLDLLAENGIIMSQHYSHHVCGPSRCALITSRLSHNLGNPFPMMTGGNLRSSYKTFIHELSDRGYINHFIGKWGIDFDDRKYSYRRGKWEPEATRNKTVGPFGRGFHTFYGMYSSGHNHFTKRIRGILDWHLFNATHLLDAPYGFNEEIDKSSTTLITRQSIDIIHQHLDINHIYNNKPFFMHISYSMPHDPLQVEDRYLDKNNFGFCHKLGSWRRKVYCAMIACIDEGVGNITNVLKKNNMFDNTVIIFASDNGGFMNVGGFNYPFRGVKSTSFEGGIRTLSFIYGLYEQQKGKIFDGMFHLVDWGPTLLSYIDSIQKKPFMHTMGDDIDGIDLSETLKEFGDGDPTLIYRNELITQSEGNNLNVTSYIEGDYKLILGSIAFNEIFYEPNDSWSVTKQNRKWHYVMMDMVNYIVENTLGSPGFFVLEWAFAFRIHSIYDWSIGNRDLRLITFGGDEKDAFIIPHLNWNQKNVESKIFLFNLKNDPSESNNLAFKNKEKVEQMYKNLKLELMKTAEIVDEDLFGYVARIFNVFSLIVLSLFTIVPAVILLVVLCCIRCLFCGKRKVKTKSD
eukprot:9586_1